MVNLFRRLRRKYFLNKELSGYLVYAGGEVVLIVVGILIALAITNYNEERNMRARENFYLAGLRSEFIQSRLKLQRLIEVNHFCYQEAKKITGYISKSQPAPRENEFSKILFNAFSSEISYNPNNSLLQEIINAGGLKEFSNDELRRHLTSWESFLRNVNHQENTLREQREHLISILKTNGSIRNIFQDAGVLQQLDIAYTNDTTSNLAVLKSKLFENTLLIYMLTAQSTQDQHYQPLLEEIDTILAILNSELQ